MARARKKKSEPIATTTAPLPSVDDAPLFIRLNSGAKFRYDDIENNVFNIHDIAHNLSKQPRFLGAPDEDYNVAQHSCLVSDYILTFGTPYEAFCGLVHDFHEAFTGDVVTPLKKFFLRHGFDVEATLHMPIDEWVYTSCGIPWPIHDYAASTVKAADFILYQAEGRNLVKNFAGSPVPADYPPYNHKITVWTRRESAAQLIARFNRLLRLSRPFGGTHGSTANSAA